ncbi:MAG TPA: peptide-methionine (S)-S-oxide reductase MsrA [Candidatus Avipropionibacterium avicola]|uniref:Peptide methionine sulfoxide reductase MsrA n=1 Tax=Candidatus Avipropionibacterium avicola TaxID=2840701 RepID=A0A9D1KNJ2_9ACTN|nr:peptide-methionine (S)-S-oxide reductase MsrA [Candidatus Avipropionibacterium avicola]
MFWTPRPTTMTTAEKALPGRDTPVLTQPTYHEIFGIRLDEPPAGTEVAHFGLGCFWGVEKLFWNTPGVKLTASGYQGGYTPNPTYEEVCSGHTGHAEVVRVHFDPTEISYEALLTLFWENHDPTQGMRQGNDIGTQYRSMILTATPEQAVAAEASRDRAAQSFAEAGYDQLTTEIVEAGPFWFAEELHQQYLEKVPNGYCPIHSTGVKCG